MLGLRHVRSRPGTWPARTGGSFSLLFPSSGLELRQRGSQVRCSGQSLSRMVHLPRAPLASALRLTPAALTALGTRGQQSRANRSLRARLIVPVAEGWLAGWRAVMDGECLALSGGRAEETGK
ncbi:unnamed protein product [Caretta caretta]